MNERTKAKPSFKSATKQQSKKCCSVSDVTDANIFGVFIGICHVYQVKRSLEDLLSTLLRVDREGWKTTCDGKKMKQRKK